MSYKIRTYGDPVLKTMASRVDDVDGKVIRLVDDMFDTLVDSGNGIALAAPQIGVQKQVVVWDIDDDRWRSSIRRSSSPTANGSTTRDACRFRACTSRCSARRRCSSAAIDLNGEIIEIEADELEARMFQHEIDHLNGVLMFDRLEGDQRKEALVEYRRIEEEAARQAARTPMRRRLGLGREGQREGPS